MLIIRDIALGSEVQKEMEVHTTSVVGGEKMGVEGVREVELVETVCKRNGSRKPAPRLYKVLLSIYRTLRKNSSSLLGERFHGRIL